MTQNKQYIEQHKNTQNNKKYIEQHKKYIERLTTEEKARKNLSGQSYINIQQEYIVITIKIHKLRY